ncbi:MAG: dTDP-4-dehydrorhamnose 3,5-epimerase [Ponticaulis sp.]|nr:dTDP-4-dehydrorhamnose 3,5-epimerase [Ponticaulis sp.]|tara:strand:- start:171742 stop:172320 length:579 start_codon:yes stop_codon:yes gene_type:complete
MDITRLDLPGLMLISPQLFEDARGSFCEVFNEKEFQRKTGVDFRVVQENRSVSLEANTIRGLHAQSPPMAQAKLVRVERGRILDCVVDIRQGSPTYLSSFAVELMDDDNCQLFVPKGFLHGFRTLEPNCRVVYSVDAYYSPEHDRSVRFDDPELGCDWGLMGAERLCLSEKDANANWFQDLDARFDYTTSRL